jgi:ubiquitin carboxyl-terminal hydrolase 7
LVSRSGTVADLLSALRQKLELADEPIRVAETHSGKVYKELRPDQNVAVINEYATLYAEKIPTEESNMDAEERIISVFSFDREPNRTHGIPFRFVVKPGELFAETKKRLSARTQIKGKNFEKIKFAVIPRATFSAAKYLEDGEYLSYNSLSSAYSRTDLTVLR